MKAGRMSFIVASIISFTIGCADNEQMMKWRKDVAPILRRMPILAACTNLLWHGEVITKNSFLSPPGPSTYRVCCFIPGASQIISSLQHMSFPVNLSRGDDVFLDDEKEMLKSEYGIDLSTEQFGLRNEQLNRELLQFPYWGECVYFKVKDVLCIIFYGE